MAAAFTNPRTGLYDTEFISQFISQAAIDPQIGYAWSSLVERALQERQFSKYASLVEAGSYVNQLEIAQGLATADKTFKGAWVGETLQGYSGFALYGDRFRDQGILRRS